MHTSVGMPLRMHTHTLNTGAHKHTHPKRESTQMHTQNKSKQEIKVGVIVSAYRMSGSVRRALQVLPHVIFTRTLQVGALVVINLISQMRKPTEVPSCTRTPNSLASLQGLYSQPGPSQLPTVTHATPGYMVPHVWCPTPHSWQPHTQTHPRLITPSPPGTRTESGHTEFLPVPTSPHPQGMAAPLNAGPGSWVPLLSSEPKA